LGPEKAKENEGKKKKSISRRTIDGKIEKSKPTHSEGE